MLFHDSYSRDAHLDQHMDARGRDYETQPRRRFARSHRPAAQSPGRTGEGAQCLGLTLATTVPGQARSRIGA